MPKSTTPQDSEASAQKYFKKAEQSETLGKQARKKEKAVSAAKTANLRELRLAKEAADKLAAETAEALSPTKAKKRAAPRPKQAKRPSVRMVY
jgi:hypothetical protein